MLGASVLLVAALQGPVFPEPLHPAAGTGGWIAVVDLDLDGNLDVVTPTSSPAGLAFLFGNGAGGLGAPQLILLGGAGDSAQGVAAGDFDGDGFLDFATALRTVHALGRVLGALGTTASFSTGAFPISVAAGDFDGDGKVDAATGGEFGGISTHLGDGAGGFAAPTVYSTNGATESLALADLDGNGSLDLVSAHSSSGTLSVRLANGAGGFGAPASLAGGKSISVADLDGNGTLDLVSLTNGLVVHLGNGGGAFPSGSTTSTPAPAFSVATGDLDGDGQRDVVASTASPGSVFVLRRDPGGAFTPAVTFSLGHPYVAGSGQSLALRDMTGDGRLDLVAALNCTGFGSAVTVLRGDGAGQLASPRRFPLVATARPNAIATGDLDGDGRSDVATANSSSYSVSVLLGDGAGGLGAATDIPVGGTAPPYDVVIAELSGDGLPDLATVHPFTGLVYVCKGTGGGAFAAPVSFATGTGGRTLVAADLTGDGTPDLVTASSFSVKLLAGLGLGTFAPAVSFPAAATPFSLAAADFNHDGGIDVAATYSAASSVAVFLNNGAGGLGAPSSVAVGAGPWSLAIGDLNDDGHADVATADSVPKSISLRFGDGLGGLTAAPSLPVVGSLKDVAIGDLNGDGIADLATANDETHCVSVLAGLGGGAFAPASHHATDLSPMAVAIADLDADGRADLASAAYFSDSVTILRNAAPPLAGASPYGIGTPGCAGRLATYGSSVPQVGNLGFRLTSTNAPLSALGFCFVTDSQDAVGNDFFHVGATIHVDFYAATEIYGFDIVSDAGGSAFAPAPIPPLTALAGKTFYAQSVFAEPLGTSCSASPYGLVSSKAVALTIQP